MQAPYWEGLPVKSNRLKGMQKLTAAAERRPQRETQKQNMTWTDTKKQTASGWGEQLNTCKPTRETLESSEFEREGETMAVGLCHRWNKRQTRTTNGTKLYL